MSHGPTKIPSKGMCIYCGRTDVRLTDEHIVPLSLGGQHIILDASCDDCADITKRFEQDVARELWGDARLSYNAPSRRKSKRKTHTVLSDPNNPNRRLKIPYADYPAPFVVYRMSRAGLLCGLPATLDISDRWELVAISDTTRNKEFESKYGMPLTARFRHVPNSFARLIAKIGYGQVLTILNDDFRPICLPYILGVKSNPSYVVGGSSTEPEPNLGAGYQLQTMGFGTPDKLMLMAQVRLLANAYSPVYHVVVGDVFGAKEVKTVLEKLGDDITRRLLTGASYCQEHWMPQTWPLPFWTFGDNTKA